MAGGYLRAAPLRSIALGRDLTHLAESSTLDRALAQGGLDVRLDVPLPSPLAVGAGTALFVAGTCFAPGERIASLALLVDGDAQPVMAHGMPRLETLRANGGDGYRSGFWGIARVGERSEPVALGLRARLENGAELTAPLATIPLASGDERVAAPPAAGPLVAVCMATCDPPPDLFRA
ncbi:MAG: hypothetical protein M3O90_09820, partial [Actinomycetota bacterium]|nr:hypothetical protein [Actinomycetota bacterium]